MSGIAAAGSDRYTAVRTFALCHLRFRSFRKAASVSGVKPEVSSGASGIMLRILYRIFDRKQQGGEKNCEFIPPCEV